VPLTKNDFFFVQIGANDGIRYDPLRPFVIQYHLKGICVEPLSDMYLKLIENYSTEKQLLFENAAIHRYNKHMTLYRFGPKAPVEDGMHALATFDEKSIRRMARKCKLEQYIEEVQVHCITLQDLFSKYCINNITLFQTDA
jgi:FkbM family methyltransferase